MGKIYILEDDKNISEIEQFALKNAGYEVSAFATASDFENALTKEHPDLIIMDIMLPDRDGLSVLKDVRAEQVRGKLIKIRCVHIKFIDDTLNHFRLFLLRQNVGGIILVSML